MRKKPCTTKPQLGVQLAIAGRDVTLFRHKQVSIVAGLRSSGQLLLPTPRISTRPTLLQIVFAMDAKCPHAGGQLALGDIEDMDGHVCVSCPVHGFMFPLTGGGVSLVPEGTYTLQLHATRLGPNGLVHILLPRTISATAFTDDDF
jgi:hypothetical protein